jgi:23S rRNA (guanosine2251-2'-O)-methyltransferase
VEGRQAVRELLAAGRRRVRELWLSEEVDAAPIVEEIVRLGVDRGVPVRRVARSRLDARAVTDAPQGVLAVAEPLREVDLEDLCRRGRAGAPPFLLAMDGVSDPMNLGGLLRTGECAGASGAILPRHRSVHITPAAAKAAAGAVEWVPMTVVPGLPAALARASELGVWVVGLDPAGAESVFDLRIATEPVVLVLGAEGRGLSRLVKQRCDVLAHIPMPGSLASLNVGAAGAVACFEIARRRQG